MRDSRAMVQKKLTRYAVPSGVRWSRQDEDDVLISSVQDTPTSASPPPPPATFTHTHTVVVTYTHISRRCVCVIAPLEFTVSPQGLST